MSANRQKAPMNGTAPHTVAHASNNGSSFTSMDPNANPAPAMQSFANASNYYGFPSYDVRPMNGNPNYRYFIPEIPQVPQAPMYAQQTAVHEWSDVMMNNILKTSGSAHQASFHSGGMDNAHTAPHSAVTGISGLNSLNTSNSGVNHLNHQNFAMNANGGDETADPSSIYYAGNYVSFQQPQQQFLQGFYAPFNPQTNVAQTYQPYIEQQGFSSVFPPPFTSISAPKVQPDTNIQQQSGSSVPKPFAPSSNVSDAAAAFSQLNLDINSNTLNTSAFPSNLSFALSQPSYGAMPLMSPFLPTSSTNANAYGPVDFGSVSAGFLDSSAPIASQPPVSQSSPNGSSLISRADDAPVESVSSVVASVAPAVLNNPAPLAAPPAVALPSQPEPSVRKPFSYADALANPLRKPAPIPASERMKQTSAPAPAVAATATPIAKGGARTESKTADSGGSSAKPRAHANGSAPARANAPSSSGNSSSQSSNRTRNMPGVNPSDFNYNLKKARCFVIKSYSADDIHKSIKYNVWASTEHGNKRLDAAFRDARGEEPIFLFFSVNGSGCFCGVAQMLTAVDYSNSFGAWAQNEKWNGQFKVKWIFIKNVPNREFRHIRLQNNQNKPVTNSRDTQDVPLEQAVQVLQIIHSFRHKNSILDEFEYFDQEEAKRQHDLQMQQKAAQEASAKGSAPAPAAAPTKNVNAVSAWGTAGKAPAKSQAQ